VHPSTQKTPFEVVYDKNPLIPSTLFIPKVKNPAASAFLNKWQANFQLAKEALAKAQAWDINYANQHRRHVEYQVGE
jgi:hypothetical protein